MFYYTFTTFDCNFIPRNAEICKVSSETKNVGKAHKYRLNRHLPTYEKIIKNLYSFYIKNNRYLYRYLLFGTACCFMPVLVVFDCRQFLLQILLNSSHPVQCWSSVSYAMQVFCLPDAIHQSSNPYHL